MKKFIVLVLFAQFCAMSSLSAQKILYAERDTLVTTLHVRIEKPVNVSLSKIYIMPFIPVFDILISFKACPWDYLDRTTDILDTVIVLGLEEYCPYPIRYDGQFGNLNISTSWDSICLLHPKEEIIYCYWINIGELVMSPSDGKCWFHNDIATFSADEATPNIQLYPNPTNDVFRIQSEADVEILSVRMFDICGKEVLKTDGKQQEISTSYLANGLYMVQIQTPKSVVLRKIVVNR